MNKRVVISGCSGGGKSTLLEEFRRRGFAIVPEPGRRIVAEEQRKGGHALPWVNAEAFARRAVDMALRDYELTGDQGGGWIFLDRGLIDAALAIDQATRDATMVDLARQHPYHSRVFLAPPWPEIYVRDDDRRHDFAAACGEYERLLEAFVDLGYAVSHLPKVDVAARADFVLRQLDAPS